MAGVVEFEASRLRVGRYTCYFHGADTSEWLVDPLEVRYTGEVPTNVEFVVKEATLRTAIRGKEYSAQVCGLVKNMTGSQATYTIAGAAPSWLTVSADGDITGTPTDATRDTRLTIRAIRGPYNDTIALTIPVRSAGSDIEDLRIVSFNTWWGGVIAEDYHDKQIKFIIESKADVMGLQEDHTGENAARLAHALSWYYWASVDSVSILTKHPIDHLHGSDGVVGKSGGVRINFDGESQTLNFWSAHLAYDPYGPYDFCFKNTPPYKVMENEARSGRPSQIAEILRGMESSIREADSTPVVLTGDFNAPSHLDWTEKNMDNNCGYFDIEWPTSVEPIKAGLIDSFREKHPDPVAVQGITYSPVHEWNSDYDRPEPKDRIDFVYYKGSKLTVLDSRVYMTGEKGHVLDNWTSDHAVVMTTYKLSS